ncbi:glycosyltransferase family 4 protein [Christiangramia fulva]|nr:glycosyltransferase family 1 protein [Christiangramia fulva]
MPRFAAMIAKGMEERGHEVKLLTVESFFFRNSAPQEIKKWLGYLDQYLVFPITFQKLKRKYPQDTLFVFADQALGPWVPLVRKHPHVVHCHDFIAQKSALGEISWNKTSFSGKFYQAFIRKGYRKASNFISISEKTRSDLHRFLKEKIGISEVVYNGLNQKFSPDDSGKALRFVEAKTGLTLPGGYVLHVGGNQFYKNRSGVLKIFNHYKELNDSPVKLLMVGAAPTEKLQKIKANSVFSKDIHFIIKPSDEFIRKVYQAASVLLYPSLYEGFGWPIAEAMASGCPVITTREAPMNEVGGNAAFYISSPPEDIVENNIWLQESANILSTVIQLSNEERKEVVEAGIANAARFDTKEALDQIEVIYKKILKTYGNESS